MMTKNLFLKSSFGVRYQKISNYILFPVYLLFFLMLFVPTAYKPIKIILVLYVIALIVMEAFSRNWRARLHPKVLHWTVAMTGIGLLFITWGLLNSAPGALECSGVYFLWPFLYTLFVFGVATQKRLEGLIKTLVIAAIFVSADNVLTVFRAIGWVPESLYFALDKTELVSFYEGFVRFGLPNTVSLSFMLPFTFAAILTWPNDRSWPVRKVWLWLGFCLSLTAVVLTGRRGIWLSTMPTLIITLFICWFLYSKHQLKKSFGLLGTLLTLGSITLMIFVFLQFTDIFQSDLALKWFTGVFESGDKFEDIRLVQFQSLTRAWMENPLFGSGLGAVAAGQDWWGAELYYSALLFYVGIIGFAAYLSGIIWIMFVGMKMLMSNDRLGWYIFPILMGMSSFLVTASTNPYLPTYDYMWIIFLPVALINLWLFRRKEPKNSEENATV